MLQIRFSGTGIAFPSFVRLLWILRKRIQRQVRPKARRQTHKQHPMAGVSIIGPGMVACLAKSVCYGRSVCTLVGEDNKSEWCVT